MTNKAKQHIFFVDDEPMVLKVVGKTLGRLGTKVSCFACAADCLEQLRSKRCDLLITDVKMPCMDGLELLTEARRIAPWLPVLVVTGYGDIAMAVKAVKTGASDFIEKPLDRQRFLSAVGALLEQNTPPDLPVGKRLTGTEIKVLRLILDGKSNKEAALKMRIPDQGPPEHSRMDPQLPGQGDQVPRLCHRHAFNRPALLRAGLRLPSVTVF